jgi:hypothetical protein
LLGEVLPEDLASPKGEKLTGEALNNPNSAVMMQNT